MNKTLSEISRLKNNTRQAVQKLIAKNKIEPSGKKGKYPTYDISIEPLASYVGIEEGIKIDKKKPELKKAEKIKITKEAQKTETQSPAVRAIRQVSKPLNDLLAGKMPPDQKPAAFFYAEALRLAKENKDATLYFKLGQIAAKEDTDEQIKIQALKTEQAKEEIAQEKADRLKIENDIKKGMYLEFDKVKTLFGRVYAVHTSILTPLSLKLSSMLAAVPEGEKKESTMRKFIDDEIFAALGSIKKILVDFVKK